LSGGVAARARFVQNKIVLRFKKSAVGTGNLRKLYT
jgi:hypothetical protein